MSKGQTEGFLHIIFKHGGYDERGENISKYGFTSRKKVIFYNS